MSRGWGVDDDVKYRHTDLEYAEWWEANAAAIGMKCFEIVALDESLTRWEAHCYDGLDPATNTLKTRWASVTTTPAQPRWLRTLDVEVTP